MLYFRKCLSMFLIIRVLKIFNFFYDIRRYWKYNYFVVFMGSEVVWGVEEWVRLFWLSFLV